MEMLKGSTSKLYLSTVLESMHMLHAIATEEADKALSVQFTVVTNLSTHRPTTSISPTEVAPKPKEPRVTCSGHAQAGQVSVLVCVCVCVCVWEGVGGYFDRHHPSETMHMM